MKLSPDLETIIEALDRLLWSTFDRNFLAQATKTHLIDIREFDGFEIMQLCDEDDYVLMGKDANDCPIWPFDAVMASYNTDQDGPYWIVHKISSLNPKEMRGKLRIVLPRMYRHVLYRIEAESRKSVSALSAYGVVNGTLVDCLNRNGADPITDTEQQRWLVSASFGFALRKRYNWSVLLGYEDGPRVRFITDPIGVREAFRFRDIQPGKRRRAALRHWVRSHWRKKRELSIRDKAWIAEHLRGATEFHWNGLRCRIEPSAVDIERAVSGKAK